MKFTRVDLTGKNGVAEIKADGDMVRIFVKEFNGLPMIFDRPKTAWEWYNGISSFSVAETIQKTLDGYVGTISYVHEYYELLVKFFE